MERIKNRILEIKKYRSGSLIVGVAGGSGSGKTSKVAQKIAEMMLDAKVLSMDDYFRGKEFMQSINSDNWDEPRVYELDLLKTHLEALKRGKSIQKPIYSFSEARRIGFQSFGPHGIIVLEGLFALYPGIVEELDLKVFVDIAIHGSLIRRILRDVKRTGQSEQDIFKQYAGTVYPMYKIYIEPTKALADIVIVNHYVPEVEANACRNQQIQLKAVLSRKIAPKELEDLGFKKAGNFFQEDAYYFAPHWKPGSYDELMRIRKEADSYFLTYMGPLKREPLRVRPKIEFEVEPALKDALEKFGYKKFLLISKERQLFLGDCGTELALDRFENGSEFLEFRMNSQEEIAKLPELLKKLGINKKDVTRKSYLELFDSKKG